MRPEPCPSHPPPTQAVASCDLNPASHQVSATPNASLRIKVFACKAVLLISSVCLDSQPKVQALLLLLSAFLATYQNLRYVRPQGFGVQALRLLLLPALFPVRDHMNIPSPPPP